METGLLAKARYQKHIQWLTLRVREQARSHIWFVLNQNSRLQTVVE